MKDLVTKLMAAIDQVHRGELEPRQLTAMASAAGAVVRVHEIGELQARLEDLEARVEQAGQGRRRSW